MFSIEPSGFLIPISATANRSIADISNILTALDTHCRKQRRKFNRLKFFKRHTDENIGLVKFLNDRQSLAVFLQQEIFLLRVDQLYFLLPVSERCAVINTDDDSDEPAAEAGNNDASRRHVVSHSVAGS